MLRNRMSGFTLIELMVVIVIIGVLASLAIPRFTEASAKAKMSEAPRVLASFESAVSAAQAEGQEVTEVDQLILKIPDDSKWWDYKGDDTEVKIAEEGSEDDDVAKMVATANNKMGQFDKGWDLTTEYKGGTQDCFAHSSEDGDESARKMVPNFFKGGCN